MAAETPSLDAIFCAAIAIPAEADRAAYLARACGGDSELRGRVEKLVQAHLRAAHPPPAPAPHAAESESLAFPFPEPPVAGALEERPGKALGPYKLLEQIGEGGFGVVFVAEQTQPVRRKVALKVLKPGMDSRRVVARFEAERQALALMDHPNIARVFDGGATASGRPYFVMELVKGVPLTDYCDQHRLTVRERLGLFVSVCQAVQHAHQKGIIHRDLKPSNILVAVHECTPAVKVIDFGVAKALGQPLTDKTLYTGFAQLVGTPLYMSPEQAALGGLDVDTRSDIYALGVVLYELLTGTTPFDRKRFLEAGYDEVRRILREEEPPKPSTRISTLGEAATAVAAQRKSDPKRLSQFFRGELDWIVMKALEKDRSRRYDTAGALAADVERYLHDEPVQACPPSRWYPLRKFVRRHRAALATTATLLSVLVAGVVFSTWQAIRAGRAEARTRKEATKAKAINDFLIKDLLAQASPRNNPGGANMTIRQLLDKAATKIDQDNALADEPEVEATIRLTIGDTYNDLALFKEAEPHVRRALDIRRRVLGPEHPDTLTVRVELADVICNLGRPAEAETHFRESLPVARRVLGEEHQDVLYIEARLAKVLADQGRADEAEALFRESLAKQRRVLGEEHEDTLDTLERLGWLLGFVQGRFSEGESLCRRSWETKARVLGKDHLWTLQAHEDLGEVLVAEGKWSEAEQHLRQSLEDLSRAETAGPEHELTMDAMNGLSYVLLMRGKITDAEPFPARALEIARGRFGPDSYKALDAEFCLAILLLTRGKPDEAERLSQDVVEARRRLCGSDHWLTLFNRAWLARALQARGKWDEAEALMRNTCADCRRVLGAENFRTLAVISDLAVLLHVRGKDTEAEPLFREALEGQRRVLPADHPNTARTLYGWANYLLDKGDAAGAEAALREALPVQRKAMIPEHGDIGRTLAALGWALTRQGRAAEGEPQLREGLVICRKGLPEGHWATADAESLLGGCLTALGRYPDAEPLLKSGYAGLHAAPGAPPLRTRQALERIIALYEAWGKPDKAAEWRQKLDAAKKAESKPAP